MTRPTRDQYAKAAFELEQLAYLDDALFHLIASILDKAEWVRAELDHHKAQAGYPRNSQVAPIGVGASSSVEAQFAPQSTPTRMYRSDPMVKAAQETRRAGLSILGRANLDLDRAVERIGYPHRSVPEGWKVG